VTFRVHRDLTLRLRQNVSWRVLSACRASAGCVGDTYC
jgi:hypothetical protein